MMKLHANAKINLCLDVVGKREDGYHEMDMIMVPLTLHDTIWIEKSAQEEYVCDQKELVFDQNNTVVKAVQLMRREFAIKDRFHIEVKKRIPMEAGLAGGSADAAAVMRGIWRMYQLPCTLSQLAFLGKQIGADVPFCVMNACALVRGIGEQLTLFHNACDFGVLLVKPTQGVSTAKAFQMLDFTQCEHPDTLLCKHALEQNNFQRFARHSGNTLEYSAFQMVPQLAVIKKQLQDLGLPFVLMSGSGSTIFACSEDRSLLQAVATKLKERYPFVSSCELMK